MKFKSIKKYLVELIAVVMVASFAVIPVSACTLDGAYNQGEYPQPNGLFTYGADGWSYCDDSPFSCELYTTIGNDFGYGDPGGTLARAFVTRADLSYQDAMLQDVTNFVILCHC